MVEAEKIMREKGWDKGIVVFGPLASESTVKVSTAVELLQQHDGFPDKRQREVGGSLF